MAIRKNSHDTTREKIHSKMRKETTTLCLFMIFWNFVSDCFWLPQMDFGGQSEMLCIDKKINVSHRCKLCDFDIDNNGTTPNSSERDVILLVAFRKLYNLFPFVHSIRTTGCKARIFVFLDQIAEQSQTEEFYKQMEDCGVQFIPLYNYDPKFLDDVYYYRYLIYHNFLFANQKDIDRVIAVDLFDSIAQHDPFTVSFKKDYMYFSNEGYSLKENDFNLKTLEFAFEGLKKINASFNRSDVNYHLLIQNPIINGGIQAGGVKPFLAFSKFMTRIGDSKTMSAYGPDQAFLNYYLHTGAFENLFKYEIKLDKTAFISTIGVWLTDEDNVFPQTAELGNFERDNVKPAIIHQFDRSQVLYEAVIKACPNDSNVNDYSRTKSERES